MPQHAEQTTVEQPIDLALLPVPAHPSGLDVFDLKVTATPLAITWDGAALNAALDAVLAEYRGIDVTVDNIPAIKTELAGLNKLKERIDTARKDISRTIKKPVDEFEVGIKKMLARITEVRGALDAQVKALEELDRNSRRVAVQLMIDAAKDKAGMPDLDIPVLDRWLNKSARTSATQSEIDNLILKAKQEQEASARAACAQADRATLVGEAVRFAVAAHGFELPMGRFSACFSLDMPAEEALAQIHTLFAAEAAAKTSAPPPTEQPPRNTADGMEEFFAMPTAPAATAEAIFPSQARPRTWDDDFAMPTVAAPVPPLADEEYRMTVRLTYDASQEPDVLHLLDRLRNVANVDVL